MSQSTSGGNQLVTGEAVAIDLRVARLGSRMIAGIVDLAIQSYVLYWVLLLAFLAVQPEDPALAAAVILLVYLAVMLGYPVACETFMRGRTVGKMMLGLRVVRDDGGPVRFRHALARGLIGLVGERPGPLLGLPAVVCMLVSSRSKRLGDLFAGTQVLQVRVPQTIGLPPRVPPPLVGWVTVLDLTGIDDELAVRARRFLARAHQLSDEARERLGGALVAEVQAAISPPPPPGTPGWAFLSAVLAERTRRAYNRMVAGGASRPRPPIPSPVPMGPAAPMPPRGPMPPAGPRPPMGPMGPMPPVQPMPPVGQPMGRWGRPRG